MAMALQPEVRCWLELAARLARLGRFMIGTPLEKTSKITVTLRGSHRKIARHTITSFLRFLHIHILHFLHCPFINIHAMIHGVNMPVAVVLAMHSATNDDAISVYLEKLKER